MTTTTIAFSDVPAPPVDAYQNVGEFGALWEYVAQRPHARVLEIGSLFGGTLWYWSHLPGVELLMSVDMPSDWQKVAEGVRDARVLWSSWMHSQIDFVDVQADSHALTTVEQVGEYAPFDFVFIDGDHSYEGVRDDFTAYSPMVRPGGVVAFHDCWPNGDRHEPGIVRWVDELRHEFSSVEWTDPDGVGICAFTLP